MGELVSLFKGQPIITSSDLEVISKCEPSSLETLYLFTSDPIQRILIREIFRLRGLPLDEGLPEEPSCA